MRRDRSRRCRLALLVSVGLCAGLVFGPGVARAGLAADGGGVTIDASATTVTYPAPVTITAHVGAASAGQTLSIYRQTPPGATRALVASGPVDANGNLTFTGKTARDALYSAVWSGDPDDEPTVTVNVRATAYAKALGGYETSGGYRLYHYTSSCNADFAGCPVFHGWAVPAQPGETFHYVMYHRVSATSWKTDGGGFTKADAHGQAVITMSYAKPGVVRLDLRVRFTLMTNTNNVGAVSPWVYFRITK